MALTTLAKLRDLLDPADTTNDTVYTDAISRASSIITERVIGRKIEETNFTEYYTGDGSKSIWLKQGPIVSVTSVSLVSYDSAGAETLEALTEGSDFWVHGLRSENHRLPGSLEHFVFWQQSTPRNYYVDYTAGWSTIPDDIVDACLHAAKWIVDKRYSGADTARDVGDGGIILRTEEELIKDLRARLRHYRGMRV